MSIINVAVKPAKARDRVATPWRLSLYGDLAQDQMTALVQQFLQGTKHHYIVSGDGYGSVTMLNGEYWGTIDRGTDLSQVARRWQRVADRFPDQFRGAVLEYRVPNALLDNADGTETVTI